MIQEDCPRIPGNGWRRRSYKSLCQESDGSAKQDVEDNSRKRESKNKTLSLEGIICKGWVRELQSEIKRGLGEGGKIILDFSKVGHFDEETASMISQFPLQKAEQRSGSLFTRAMMSIENRGEK